MTRQTLILLAALGSFGLLAGAFFFQALGWAPCAMCLWQRWPHAAAIVIGALGYLAPSRAVAALGAVSMAIGSGLALFHTGVERDWWEGPASCTSSGDGLSGLSGDALLPGATTDAPALVLCDAFTPFLFGLSMANWNLLASLGLLALWLVATFAPLRTR